MKQDSILSMIGLARKAGNVVSGEFSTEKAIKERKARLVVVADDASDNTKKLFTNKCTYYNIPLYFYSDKDNIGRALGYEIRTSLAVTDEGFANALVKKFQTILGG